MVLLNLGTRRVATTSAVAGCSDRYNGVVDFDNIALTEGDTGALIY